MTIYCVELAARRLALGLARTQLAQITGWGSANTSRAARHIRECEQNLRTIPQFIVKCIERLEQIRDSIVAGMVQQIHSGENKIVTYITDAELWAAHPELGDTTLISDQPTTGIPASLHQIAAAVASQITGNNTPIISANRFERSAVKPSTPA
jgi:hypothetical protein